MRKIAAEKGSAWNGLTSYLIEDSWKLLLRLFPVLLANKRRRKALKMEKETKIQGEEKVKRALEPVFDSPLVRVLLVEIATVLLKIGKDWIESLGKD